MRAELSHFGSDRLVQLVNAVPHDTMDGISIGNIVSKNKKDYDVEAKPYRTNSSVRQFESNPIDVDKQEKLFEHSLSTLAFRLFEAGSLTNKIQTDARAKHITQRSHTDNW